MRDIYVCVIFLRVKIYLMFFYWSHFFDVHFSYCEVFMCQVFPDTNGSPNYVKEVAIVKEVEIGKEVCIVVGQQRKQRLPQLCEGGCNSQGV